MKQVVAGVDIGGTNTLFGLVDSKGKVLAGNRILTSDYTEISKFIEALSEAINKLVKKDHDLIGIGIGAPNANYYKGTIELAPNLPWKGVVPLAELMKKKNNVPVIVTNDANAAAVGEMVFGGARKMKNFIVLTLGTGLGSGIVINGEVVYGHTAFAGELGHTTVVPGGRECGCGRQGCFETYASASGLVRTVLQILSETRQESTLRDLPPSSLTSKIIAEAAAKKDPVALEAMDYTAEMLAFGITNAVVFSSPEAVFLFGGLTKAGDILFKPVREYVDMNIMPVFKGSLKILPSGIPENNAAVLGAAALAWNELKKSGSDRVNKK
jgi:glucokinase